MTYIAQAQFKPDNENYHYWGNAEFRPDGEPDGIFFRWEHRTLEGAIEHLSGVSVSYGEPVTPILGVVESEDCIWSVKAKQ